MVGCWYGNGFYPTKSLGGTQKMVNITSQQGADGPHHAKAEVCHEGAAIRGLVRSWYGNGMDFCAGSEDIRRPYWKPGTVVVQRFHVKIEDLNCRDDTGTTLRKADANGMTQSGYMKENQIAWQPPLSRSDTSIYISRIGLCKACPIFGSEYGILPNNPKKTWYTFESLYEKGVRFKKNQTSQAGKHDLPFPCHALPVPNGRQQRANLNPQAATHHNSFRRWSLHHPNLSMT